jgi:quercetin dioxygenase-like cupin family protein
VSERRYSSKDFGRTERALRVEMPERLVHRAVERTSEDATFSRERKHPVSVVDVPSKVVSMTIGGLLPGQKTSRHRHSYETILFVLEGRGLTVIEDRRIEWEPGDAIYIPVWAWHHHENASTALGCRYVACENAPLLQTLGAAVREEEE